MKTEILPVKSLPKSAYYKPRNRYRAEKILTSLKQNDIERCTKTVGFTKRDISTTKGGYKDWGILGLAFMDGKVAVVSTFRVKHKLYDRQMQRMVKVTNHELGHTFGMPHISQKGCLMSDVGGAIKTIDQESGLLCESTMKTIEGTYSIKIPRYKMFPWDKI